MAVVIIGVGVKHHTDMTNSHGAAADSLSALTALLSLIVLVVLLSLCAAKKRGKKGEDDDRRDSLEEADRKVNQFNMEVNPLRAKIKSPKSAGNNPAEGLGAQMPRRRINENFDGRDVEDRLEDLADSLNDEFGTSSKSPEQQKLVKSTWADGSPVWKAPPPPAELPPNSEKSWADQRDSTHARLFSDKPPQEQAPYVAFGPLSQGGPSTNTSTKSAPIWHEQDDDEGYLHVAGAGNRTGSASSVATDDGKGRGLASQLNSLLARGPTPEKKTPHATLEVPTITVNDHEEGENGEPVERRTTLDAFEMLSETAQVLPHSERAKGPIGKRRPSRFVAGAKTGSSTDTQPNTRPVSVISTGSIDSSSSRAIKSEDTNETLQTSHVTEDAVKKWLAYTFSKDQAVDLIKRAKGNPGLFCFRDGTMGKVLCVQLSDELDIGHFRIIEDEFGKVEVSDLDVVEGKKFDSVFAAINFLQKNVINSKLGFKLSNCLLIPSEVSAVKEAKFSSTQSNQTNLATTNKVRATKRQAPAEKKLSDSTAKQPKKVLAAGGKQGKKVSKSKKGGGTTAHNKWFDSDDSDTNSDSQIDGVAV